MTESVTFTASCPCCSRPALWRAEQHGTYPNTTSRIARIDHQEQL